MKPTRLLLALLFCHIAFAKTYSEKPETVITSKISEVTVYLSGAQITRTANIDLTQGTTTFLLENLSPFIDENSIQISGLQNASILSINYGLDYLNTPKYPEKIEILRKKRKDIKIQIARINSEIEGFSKEEDVLNTNKRLGSETVEISIEKVKEMAQYYRDRLTEIRNNIIDANIKKEDLHRELDTIDKQFAEFNVSEETQKGVITVTLNTSAASNLNIQLNYVVSEAGWFPIYDIRANTINAPMDLLYKSHVYQKTGVDWDQANLILSTGDPNTDNNKPQVDTKFLDFVNPYAYRNTAKAKAAYKYKYNPNVRTVTGTVYEENGALPGAYVVVKGTNNGTQTDFDGKFSIQVDQGEYLQFSYVGYQSKEIPIHASNLSVQLIAHNTLDEVLITAQGIARKKEALGYAVSEVLEGQVPGVSIDSRAGTSGSTPNVVIRGFSSINASNQALFIVDGVPFDGNPTNGGYNNGNSNASRYLDLDPDQIANVEVLKGLAAATLYGTSGRNGVILITTKSGEAKHGTATGQVKIDALTTTRFEISTPYSIPTDGDVTVIEIDKFKVPANYQYYAAPLLNENVFLTANIIDWEKYNLLPGEANIYFEGSFSGKTFIDPLATTEKLTISLGVDANVIVKREQVDNFKATSFIGSQRIVSNEFEIKIKNNKNTSINLKLVDRIPKSQNKEIKVDEIETKDAIYNKETGILNWNINIPTKTNVDKRFSYRLKYPKFKSINL